MNDFNLLVSSPRFREEDASDEILDLLDAFGDPDAEVEITRVAGIILARTSIHSVTVVEKLKGLVASEPWEVRYVMRVLPIEKVVPAELEDISGAVGSMAARIPEDASFKVMVEKRHCDLHSREIIDYVAQEVKRKVDLENPGWIVLVEIVGRHAGISVVTPDKFFSSVVEKRESGD
ncbi:MAG TPA: THUMP domain-containing protein [Nitrososphaera sp.]